ncbi:MAG: hypothetical protein K2G32_00740 [Oscillospiraceae bacterium]|nr:hypothetical protein [Oscillospiraceae bacterium]
MKYRKICAAAAAFVMTASLCGCADSGYLMTVDGVQIRNGIYLYSELNALNRAYSEITEDRREYGDTSEVEDIFKETIDDESTADWVKRETMESVKRIVAVQRLCEQNGIALSDEQTNDIGTQINSMWNDENGYAQMLYGVDTIGEYYESIGIGKDSMRDIYISNDMSNELFLHYYDTDGVTPVTEEEFNSYITENYAAAKVIEIEYKDYQGIMLKEDEEIQAVKDLAQSYVDRINGGESFADIRYEVDLKNAQNDAQVDAEDAYDEMEAEDRPDDRDKYVQEAIDAVTVEKKTEDQLDTILNKESTSYSLDEEVVEYIWNTAADGKAALLEQDNSCYIIVREDITTKETWKENVKTTVLNALKSDDFEFLLETIYCDYVVEQDDYLVNTKYAPNKIKGFE